MSQTKTILIVEERIVERGDKPWSSGQGRGLTTHIQEDMGSNPTVYWMDVSDASYYIFIEKKKNKGSQMGHTKKIFEKISYG